MMTCSSGMMKRGVQAAERPDPARRTIRNRFDARLFAAAKHKRFNLRPERVDCVLDHCAAIDHRERLITAESRR